jgi:hypothetical protein
MGEIKSSVEIAVEKTKHLKMTREESERFKREELMHKAEGLANRYLSGEYNLEQVEDEIEKTPQGEQEELLHTVVSYFTHDIALRKSPQLALHALRQFLKDSKKEVVLRKIEEVFTLYDKETHIEHQKVTSLFKNELQKKGFSGSAVVPNVEESRKWHQSLQEITTRYESEITHLTHHVLQGLT